MIKYDYAQEQFGEAVKALKRRGTLRDKVSAALTPIKVLTDGRASIPDDIRERFHALVKLDVSEMTEGDLLEAQKEIKDLEVIVNSAYKEAVRASRKRK